MKFYLTNWMLKGSTRQYVIDKIKAPLMGYIINYADWFLEVTHENAQKTNTHIWLGIRDLFLEYENNKSRQELFPALWRIFIGEYEGYKVDRKRELLKAVALEVINLLPEPTKANCIKPNTHILIDIRDDFFSGLELGEDEKFYYAAWKLIIIEYEHDVYYADRIDFIVEQFFYNYKKWVLTDHPIDFALSLLLKTKWQGRQPKRPRTHWLEPELKIIKPNSFSINESRILNG